MLSELAAAVRSATPRLGATKLVVLDGPSGSGKTVLAGRLRAELDATLVSTDDFATWDEPFSWWPRLRDGILEPLRRGEPGEYRCVEWRDGRPLPGRWRTVPVPDALVLEGVSAGRRAVAEYVSHAVWVSYGTPSQRLERAVARDGEDQRANLERWQHAEAGWFAVDRPDLRAHSTCRSR